MFSKNKLDMDPLLIAILRVGLMPNKRRVGYSHKSGPSENPYLTVILHTPPIPIPERKSEDTNTDSISAFC